MPSQKLTWPENGWLEYDRFLLGCLGLFSGANCHFRDGKSPRIVLNIKTQMAGRQSFGGQLGQGPQSIFVAAYCHGTGTLAAWVECGPLTILLQSHFIGVPY